MLQNNLSYIKLDSCRLHAALNVCFNSIDSTKMIETKPPVDKNNFQFEISALTLEQYFRNTFLLFNLGFCKIEDRE